MPSLLHRKAEAGRHRWQGGALRAPVRRPQGRQEVAARRDALLEAKCRALVRSRWGDEADAAFVGGFPGGAALAAGGTAWVLAEDEPARRLGGALVWAARRDATRVHVLASAASGLLARRAAWFEPEVRVWRVEGTAVHPAAIEELPAAPETDPRSEAFTALFERAGADPVVEGGIVRAEVRGLEVARVEQDEDGAPRLAVGVGKHDRYAQREVRGEAQGFDELFEVVRIVAEHRVADGAGHAAFHLSAERWLRSVVLRRPDLVGGSQLRPVPSSARRDDLRAPAPAPAAGISSDTEDPLLVVCSVGTDLDLVPSAVDAWLADGRRPHLRFVVPVGDDHRATHDLVALLRMAADIVTVTPDWRRL